MMVIVAAGTAASDLAAGPAMVAAADRLADGVDDVAIARVGDDAAGVIARESLGLVDVEPGRAAIVGAPHSAIVLGIDDRVELERPALARGRDADPAERPAWPATPRQSPPMNAAVVGAVDGAARPGGLGEIALPRPLPRLPRRGEDRVGMLGVAGKVDRAGPRPCAQRMRPVLAAVGRAIDAARLARPEEMPDRRDKHGVGVARVDPDPADIARVAQPEVLPGRAAVGGAIDPAPRLDVIARLGLAAADIDRVGPRRRHRDCPDRRAAALVEQGLPRPPAVVGLPHAPARGREDIAVGATGEALDHFRPAGAERAELTPVKCRVKRGVERARRRGRRGSGSKRRGDAGEQGEQSGRTRHRSTPVTGATVLAQLGRPRQAHETKRAPRAGRALGSGIAVRA